MSASRLFEEHLVGANAVLRRWVYRSPAVTGWLFGIRPSESSDVSYFEPGTLAMKRSLENVLRDGHRALEIGTGPQAILALWASNRWRIDLTATEVDSAWSESASRCAQRSNRKPHVECRNLLDGIAGEFDVIWFVPPFLSEEAFQRCREARTASSAAEVGRLRRRSCGGEQGWELIDRFLQQAHDHLRDRGAVLVCINTFRQDTSKLVQCAARAGFCATLQRPLWPLPYVVMIGRPELASK